MARPKKVLPQITMLDRRLAHPFGAPSVPITLKDGQLWAVRIANDKVRNGRVHQMGQLGWTFVTPEEMDGKPADYGFRALDGRVVRGEHAEEVLMKMPQADYDQIQDAKARINLKNLGSKKTKEAAAQATAVEFGPEAGDAVYSAKIDVKDGRVEEEHLDTPA